MTITTFPTQTQPFVATRYQATKKVSGPASFVAGIKQSVQGLKRLETVYPGLSVNWMGVGYNARTDLEIGEVRVTGPKEGVDTVVGILNGMRTTQAAGRPQSPGFW